MVSPYCRSKLHADFDTLLTCGIVFSSNISYIIIHCGVMVSVTAYHDRHWGSNPSVGFKFQLPDNT